MNKIFDFETMQKIVRETVRSRARKLRPGQPVTGDLRELGLDSLDCLETILEIEERTGVKADERIMNRGHIYSVEDMFELFRQDAK